MHNNNINRREMRITLKGGKDPLLAFFSVWILRHLVNKIMVYKIKYEEK